MNATSADWRWNPRRCPDCGGPLQRIGVPGGFRVACNVCEIDGPPPRRRVRDGLAAPRKDGEA